MADQHLDGLVMAEEVEELEKEEKEEVGAHGPHQPCTGMRSLALMLTMEVRSEVDERKTNSSSEKEKLLLLLLLFLLFLDCSASYRLQFHSLLFSPLGGAVEQISGPGSVATS